LSVSLCFSCAASPAENEQGRSVRNSRELELTKYVLITGAKGGMEKQELKF
jgi:hypothetical protein